MILRTARLALVPVEESAELRFPPGWPPPLFGEAESFPGERELVIARSGDAVGMIALGPRGARVEVGYAVLEAHRGQGVATEALRAAVEHAFADDPDTREIVARVRPDSAASIRVLQNAGFECASEASGFVVLTRRR